MELLHTLLNYVFQIINFLDVHNGSLMVIITVIYVIATCKICKANITSAVASRDQLTESQHQYNESKRLERMPYIDVCITENVETENIFDSDIQLNITGEHAPVSTMFSEWFNLKNIGAGTATHLSYQWINHDSKQVNGTFPFSTFEIGELRILSIIFNTELFDNLPSYNANASLLLCFSDLLGNPYHQEVEFSFEITAPDKTKITKITIHPPMFLSEKDK